MPDADLSLWIKCTPCLYDCYNDFFLKKLSTNEEQEHI